MSSTQAQIENKIGCEICGGLYHFLPTHLVTHNTTTEEYRELFSNSPIMSKYYKRRYKKGIIKREADPDFHKKQAKVMRKWWKVPERRERHSQICKEAAAKRVITPAIRQRKSEIMKELWSKPEVRKARSEKLKGKTYEEIYGIEEAKEQREIRSMGNLRWFENEGREEIIEIIRERSNNLWKDEEYKRKWREGLKKRAEKLQNRPTGLENQIVETIKQYNIPLKYTGDGSCLIEHKHTVLNPDFIHSNGKRKIVEVFGDYWHEPEEEASRIAAFREHGYDCLVIWEHEIETSTKDIIASKIMNFIGEG